MLLDGSIDSLSIPGNVTNLRRSVSGNRTIEMRQEQPVQLYLSPPNGPMYLNFDSPSDGLANRLSNSTKWSVTGKDTERVVKEDRDSIVHAVQSLADVQLQA